MFAKPKLTAVAAVAALGLGSVATAVAAEIPPIDDPQPRVQRTGTAVLDAPGEKLDRAIRIDRLRHRYRTALADARAAGVESGRAEERSVIGGPVVPAELRRETGELRERVRRAESARRIEGVPRANLEAIAACESGGDPGAISSGGTYRGKYQFSTGTWASVGGEGDPAAAPEAEQGRRAAILYARSGSSLWPVCGQ